jgi:hypothetical protein
VYLINSLSGKIGNDNTRVVSHSMENLFLSLYRKSDKPFIEHIYNDYIDFVNRKIEYYDKTTGEVFIPENFRYKDGKPIEVSKATVWNYLKDVVNFTSIYADRNGNFDYMNTMRPKNYRKAGQFSLSKVSMDDVALSRKSVRGWIYKYIAVDVVSGYIFRPCYIVGKPNISTINETLRNMFIEIMELGLPIPGQLDVEHHLISDMDWLKEVFPFIYFNPTAWSKRAEHTNKQFKYGIQKQNKHTNMRWYGKIEAYKSVRNKVSGDYIEPQYQPQTIIADDLADIEKYNNSLHPKQKTYPGMTRKDVLVACANKELPIAEKYMIYKYLGNSDNCTIYNNDYVKAAHCEFELSDFNCLKQLKPNNWNVTAYWLPQEDGKVEKVYLYQDDTYIGEATNRAEKRYNENIVEQTEQDKENMLHQAKRAAKFDKFIKERRQEIGKTDAYISENAVFASEEIKDLIIAENEQPKGYEVDAEWAEDNYEEMALATL